MDNGKKFAYGLLALIVVAGFNACGDKNHTGSTETAGATLSDSDRAAIEAQAHKDAQTSPADKIANKVSPDVFDEYTPDQFPKLYKKLGKAGAKDAEKGARAAAYKAALSDDCDSVQIASITMDSTKSKQRFFVNCANAKQWHFDAAELKDSHGKWFTPDTVAQIAAPGESDTDKRKKYLADLQQTAPGGVMECEELLKQRLKHPASANFHSIMGAADFINPKDERAVQIEFEAKNGFNAELTYTGQCVFHKNGKVSVDIFDR